MLHILKLNFDVLVFSWQTFCSLVFVKLVVQPQFHMAHWCETHPLGTFHDPCIAKYCPHLPPPSPETQGGSWWQDFSSSAPPSKDSNSSSIASKPHPVNLSLRLSALFLSNNFASHIFTNLLDISCTHRWCICVDAICSLYKCSYYLLRPIGHFGGGGGNINLWS